MRGYNQVCGTWGQMWFNGTLIAELKSFEAKVTANRTDVLMGMSMDSKLLSLSGEGTYSVNKVYTRGKKEILEAWKKGQDTRVTLVGKIQDPDSVRGQSERVTIDNVWLNDIILLQFEKGSECTEEYSFGFTPEDASFVDIISA